MRISIVAAAYDRFIETPEAALARYFHIPGLASALAARGHRLTVIQNFHRAAQFERDGVAYRFTRQSAIAQQTERLITARWGRARALAVVPSRAVMGPLADSLPDIVLFLGLTMGASLSACAAFCRRRKIPLFATYHGGNPPANRWMKSVLRRAYGTASGLFFISREHAVPWLEGGLIDDPAKIIIAPETSTEMMPRDPLGARRRLGLDGNPLCFSGARLAAGKDPATTLAGFERLVRKRPDARLYMAYTEAPMLPAVKKQIAASPGLSGRVRLLGKIAPPDMADYLGAADLLVQSSLFEAGGSLLTEAIACGVAPVVTDIAAHRAITGNGAVGALFPVGDARALGKAALAVVDKIGTGDSATAARQTVRDYFDARLSYPRLAEIYETTFQDACHRPPGA